jgi:hypothetical protein
MKDVLFTTVLTMMYSGFADAGYFLTSALVVSGLGKF